MGDFSRQLCGYHKSRPLGFFANRFILYQKRNELGKILKRINNLKKLYSEFKPFTVPAIHIEYYNADSKVAEILKIEKSMNS